MRTKMGTKNIKKGKHFESCGMKPRDSKIKFLSKQYIKHVISIIMQLKLEQGCFKSWLIRMTNYETKSATEIAVVL
jgi:hypothetical protein